MIPWWVPSSTLVKRTSPRFAYIRMLRAISEIAAAMTVWSPPEKPSSAANSRPVWRAWTMSVSAAMRQRRSSATVDASMPWTIVDAPVPLEIEKCEALFEVEGGGDAFEGEPELHHGEGDLGLNADDHRFCATQPRHVGDVPQRADGERVHHVERRHVHDYPAGAEFSHPRDQRLAQLRQVRVRQGRLDRRDQVM